jgi:Cu2+-containing amine oxidase
MTFHVGQKVVCVDATLPANPWHREHPLVLKRIYVVQHCFVECIDIDGSRRGWQNWRFRPVVEKRTDISIFTAMLNTKQREHSLIG